MLDLANPEVDSLTAPALFDLFEQIYTSRHEYAARWKQERTGKVAAYLCTYVPEEILHAAGLLPVRVMGSHEVQDLTERHIFSPTWCPYCRDCLSEVLLGRYGYVDALVQGSTCRHMDQTFNTWRLHQPRSFSYNLYIPGHIQGTFAGECLAAEMAQFRLNLERWLGQPISENDLEKSIATYDENRSLLRELYDRRKADAVPVTGADAMKVVLASQVMDKAEHSRLLRELLKKLPEAVRESGDIRLMILGSEMDDLNLMDLIESFGAVVVTDEHCSGSRYFWNETPPGADSISRLAERYVQRPPCPHKDLVDRYRHVFVKSMVEEFRVQGAIFIHQKNCDIHNLDLPTMRQFLRNLGVPSLHLELDVTTPIGQFRTRLEAFVEMLQEGA